jgi:hypothetical protein
MNIKLKKKALKYLNLLLTQRTKTYTNNIKTYILIISYIHTYVCRYKVYYIPKTNR